MTTPPRLTPRPWWQILLAGLVISWLIGLGLYVLTASPQEAWDAGNGKGFVDHVAYSFGYMSAPVAFVAPLVTLILLAYLGIRRWRRRGQSAT